MEPSRPKPELAWWDAALALILSVVVFSSWLLGLAMNVVNVLLMAYVPLALVTRGWAAAKGKLAIGFVRRPFASENRWFLVQAVVRWTFGLVWVLVLRATILPLQLGESADGVWMVLVAVLFVFAVAPLAPKRRILSCRLVLGVGMTVFFGAQLVMPVLPVASSDVLAMDSPLRKEVLVVQGGRSPLFNHHFLLRGQRNALDLVVLKNGKLFDGNETDLASHGCFGEPVHAPLAGTVVRVTNDRPDVPYGTTDREKIVGNHVVLEVGPERFVLFAHLKQGSVLVREGERVACGQILAQCGNSGNTSAPHLHVQAQSRADFTAPDLETYPIVFRDAVIERGGASRKEPTLLRRNDRVRPSPASAACR